MNAAAVNHQVVLAARPEGLPAPEDFAVQSVPLQRPADGEVLLRHSFFALQPSARLHMRASSYRASLGIGQVIPGNAVGEVVESRSPQFRPGDLVVHRDGGWQEFSVCAAPALWRADASIAPPQAWLGVLGTSGLTGYVGLLDIGRPMAGETVVVSAATGSVGSLVGQIARLKGCRVVGIAGGAAKGKLAVEKFGFDACVDYRAPDFASQLQAACPGGIDVYFDNVGGAVRDAVWPHMKQFGRVVVCGLISEYNGAAAPGPAWMDLLTKRLSVRGFIVVDHLDRFDAFVRDMGAWSRSGAVVAEEHVTDGLESAIGAFIGMLNGQNHGKALVRL